MECARREWDVEMFHTVGEVSILVFMECARRDMMHDSRYTMQNVSILVFMECARRAVVAMPPVVLAPLSFNPCFYGMCS